jgi:hypothetical protein
LFLSGDDGREMSLTSGAFYVDTGGNESFVAGSSSLGMGLLLVPSSGDGSWQYSMWYVVYQPFSFNTSIQHVKLVNQ